MRIRWMVERDPFCRRVLASHWPDVPIHENVRRKLALEHVDVVAGGFPCQPISNAGRRLHDLDDRWLWPQMLGVIRQVRPRWVLIENVEGLRTKGLQDVLEGLAECGYDAEWDRLPASAFGAPHQRRRYFVVAYPCGARCNAYARVFGAHREAWSGGEADRPLHAGETAANSCGQRRKKSLSIAQPERPQVSRALVDWGIYRGAVERWEVISGRPSPQPLVRRVDDGLSRGMALGSLTEELKALGNAVVPQVSEWIGRQIIAADREMRRELAA
jgi:DNA (cytosine-5)-methyltransferase 1